MSDVNGAAAQLDVAVFVDVDNIWIACREDNIPFQPGFIQDLARSEGRVIISRAYADWSEGYLHQAKLRLQEEAFEFAQLPGASNGKNTADIQLAVDALEAALLPNPPGVIVLVSGDRDFVPLANKLRRYRIRVVGVGVDGTVAQQFKRACDAYYSYQELIGFVPEPEEEDELISDEETDSGTEEVEVDEDSEGPDEVDIEEPKDHIRSQSDVLAMLRRSVANSQLDSDRETICQLLVKAIAAVIRQNQPTSGSAAKLMMERLDSTFSLVRGRYNQFRELLEDAQERGLVKIIEPGYGGGDLRLELTPEGHLSLGYTPEPEYATPEAQAKAYAAILERTNVPLIPHPWRENLVHDLHEFVTEDLRNAVSMREMTDWIRERSRMEYAFTASPAAFRKLIWALNLANCFKNSHGEVCQQDEYDRCVFALSPEESLDLIEARYVAKVRIEDAAVKITREGVALWLFGEAGDEQVQRATKLIERSQRQHRSSI